MNVDNRTIFQGDNLHILRGLDSETIDLIYLDPPFNSNRTYEAPIGSEAAGAAFKDAWTLSDLDNAWHGELAEYEPALYSAISAAEFSHSKGMKAYLIMMGIRMLELRRVLKPTGSIYLHCDPTASHYLKAMMDSIFGWKNFRAEIIWKRHNSHNDKLYGTIHETIFYYSYGERNIPDEVLIPLSDKRVDAYGVSDEHGEYEKADLTAAGRSGGESGQPWRGVDPGNRHWAPPRTGKYAAYIQQHFIPNYRDIESVHARLDILDKMGLIHWSGRGKPRLKRYLMPNAGQPPQSIWMDISPVKGDEDLDYPTQKPLALLERIIKGSSKRGDIVLDPFCGCATTCIAAESLQREWIGMDLSPKAVELVKLRLERDLNIHDYEGLLGDKVIHRTDIPTRLVPDAPRQIHAATLFSLDDGESMALSQVELRQYRSYKHTLFGLQEGKCNGCDVLFPFRNMTIDHIIPQSKGGTNDPDNLQLLCGACNSTKGNRTQDELIQSLRDQGVLREGP